ncbi:MAG: PAS domain-containing protein, partial [Syntrophaceae bacterium]
MRKKKSEVKAAAVDLNKAGGGSIDYESPREMDYLLHSIVQGFSIPSFVIGKDHKIIYWNKALESLSGISANEVVGTNQQWRAFYANERPCMADLLMDGSFDRIPKWYAGKYRKSELLDEAYEATDFFSDLGEKGKWLRFTAALIRDSQQNVVGAVETLEDITEKVMADIAKRESDQKLFRVIEGSPIPAFVIGLDHKVIYWNRALEKLSKIPAEEIIGTSQHWRAFYASERPGMADILVNESLETIPEWYPGISKSNLLDETYEAEGFFPDLGVGGRWLRFTAAAIRNSRGGLVGAIETLEDISERKSMERKLVESERKLSSI